MSPPQTNDNTKCLACRWRRMLIPCRDSRALANEKRRVELEIAIMDDPSFREEITRQNLRAAGF